VNLGLSPRCGYSVCLVSSPDRSDQIVFFTLPLFQDTSEWTLDYPPFFAWFEKLLSQFAVLVNPKIVDVENLYYDSPSTVYFQRTTVIVSELVLFWALQRMLTVMGNRPLQKIISWSLMLNPGLIMVDNMHFQYNGFLYGIMIHSLVDAKQVTQIRMGFQKKKKKVCREVLPRKNIRLTFLFFYCCDEPCRESFCDQGSCLRRCSTLSTSTCILHRRISPFCFVHTALRTLATVFEVPLPLLISLDSEVIHRYRSLNPLSCLRLAPCPIARSWISAFRPFRLVTLGFCVIAVFAASLGPFAAMHQLPQLASRLFPFKRGLCHSYWAANFWALYSFVDRAMIILVSKTPLGQYFGLSVDASALAATTRGLVGDTAFGVLPAVTAQDTLIATVVLQIPGLISVFRKPTFERFVGSIALSAFASFLTGWHVHEKAILLCTVTMSVSIANMVGAGAHSDQKGPVLTPRDVRSFMIVSLAGYVGLWPLFFTREGNEERHPPLWAVVMDGNACSYLSRLVILKWFSGMACTVIETLIKVLITWIWFVVVGSGLDQCITKPGFYSTETGRSMFRYFTTLECLYIFGFVPAQLYVNVIHEAVFGQKTLEFLPLMITSVYSAMGVVYGWLLYSATYFSSGKATEKRKTR